MGLAKETIRPSPYGLPGKTLYFLMM